MSTPIASVLKLPNWQDPSKYKIEFNGPGASFMGIDKGENGVGTGNEIISIACQGIQLAEVNTTPVKEYIGEEWRIITGRLETYQISLTFKDYNNFHLYKTFAGGLQNFTRMYPDDQKMDISVFTADSFYPDNLEKILVFKDCILASVSGASLSNSATNSVAEFNVVMECSYVITY